MRKMLNALLPFIVTGTLVFLPMIIALVDILTSEFTESNKIVWLLVVILVPFIGFILYFLIGTKQKIKLPK